MSLSLEFKALTGHEPFRWQTRLHARLRVGDVPEACDIGTGLGKTSAIALWLVAMADQVRHESQGEQLPRRLVYIVDRRVVVDQATEEVENLARRLEAARKDAAHPLASLAAALKAEALRDDEPLIAISTLRGKMADNQEWLHNPAKPTIIVGTVDMIGSRLLFSPYGRAGRSRRAMQAGLMGQDTLVVVDEAHLCPSFVQTLRSVRGYVDLYPTVRPFRMMELSATQLDSGSDTATVFRLDKALGDFNDPEVSRRLDAVKRLTVVRANPVDPGEAKAKIVAESMARQAIKLAGPCGSVAVFANTVGMVNEIAKLLEGKGDVLVLTGEMRGYERDELVAEGRLRWFSRRMDRPDQKNKIAFLVATACAEVGINFDADHAVCDVVPLERMIQRFGRVNRFGDGSANIVVVDASAQDAVAPTLAVLHLLPEGEGALSASPSALQGLDRTSDNFKRAWSPAPPYPVLDEALIDGWSMTSFEARTQNDSTPSFPKPQVSYWLRGLVVDDSITIDFVWRDEFDLCADATDAIRMARTIPVSPREISSVNVIRVKDLLKGVGHVDAKGWVVHCSAADEWQARWLSGLADDERWIDQLQGGTVFLPCSAGGLREGVPDPLCRDRVVDQVNLPAGGVALWLRPRIQQSFNKRYIVDVQRDDTDDELRPNEVLYELSEEETIKEAVAVIDAFKDYTIVSNPDDDVSPSGLVRVIYLRRADLPGDGIAKTIDRRKVLLDDHNSDVEKEAKRLCEILDIKPPFANAIQLAARWHDTGKQASRWQAAIGCTCEPWLAKSESPSFDYSSTKGYRHEFGSLARFLADGQLSLPKEEQMQDLVLHLIASHHGWARPHFEPQAFDPERVDSPAIAAQAALRFAKLQRSLGWWQLAYLESLLKAADARASQNPTIRPH